MEQKDLCIEKIPAVIWGTHSNKMYLYVHGQGGNKKEAKDFASIAVKYGYQVLNLPYLLREKQISTLLTLHSQMPTY